MYFLNKAKIIFLHNNKNYFLKWEHFNLKYYILITVTYLHIMQITYYTHDVFKETYLFLERYYKLYFVAHL